MENTAIETYILPACWASALINSDLSGMSDDDERELNSWVERTNPGSCVGCSEEPYFRWRNDATSFGGDVLEYSFIKY